jgi:rubrerythrin
MLADGMGLDKMRERFERCLEQEAEHLVIVKRWYEEALQAQLMKGSSSGSSGSSGKQTRH